MLLLSMQQTLLDEIEINSPAQIQIVTTVVTPSTYVTGQVVAKRASFLLALEKKEGIKGSAISTHQGGYKP